VVQKHAATRLHYDFRLESEGTLKSWAVPKGIPLKRGEKRLAIHVEDHPVSYIDFEGTIPKGQYGGGTVMVWDRGTYEPLDGETSRGMKEGNLHVALKGEKLKGEWRLVRLRDGDQWLLIRGGGDMKPISARKDDTSVLSGKSMKGITAAGGPVWGAKRKAAAAKPAKKTSRRTSHAAPPAFVEPMKARLVDAPPPGKWHYEIKFDGFRALACVNGGAVRLYSRTRKDLGEKFPGILEAVQELELGDSILDGEIVALDAKGRSSFQSLQAFELGTERPPLFYYLFDLLRLEGRDLRKLPVSERKERLAGILKGFSDPLRFSGFLGGTPERLLRQAERLGIEGLIGKKEGSAYESGRRSGAWIKLKLHHEQEFVIGGYTDPGGSRSHFGALLIGVHEGRRLVFSAKVGTGFDAALLRELHGRFQRIGRKECPFSNLPETRRSRYGQAITASEMKRCHWLKPELVCQVRFSEWTRDGSLRQPVFLGLREDKKARDVVREKASHGV
jgi:bifunctional non-homologous end joining protein LigD